MVMGKDAAGLGRVACQISLTRPSSMVWEYVTNSRATDLELSRLGVVCPLGEFIRHYWVFSGLVSSVLCVKWTVKGAKKAWQTSLLGCCSKLGFVELQFTFGENIRITSL